MENIQKPVLRKLRKIKRPKMGSQPITFSVPEKAGNPTVQQPQRQTAPQQQPQRQAAPQQQQPQRQAAPQQPQQQMQTQNLPQKNNQNRETLYNQNAGMETIRFVGDDESEESYVEHNESIGSLFTNKTVMLGMILATLVGMFIGATAFSSTDSSKRGLEGVVGNPDVPAGRSRCGLVDKRQGCVLYIMNPKDQNVNGKDFYSAAAQWTKREKYQIEVGNMHYGNKIIKPGQIAQIYIPPL